MKFLPGRLLLRVKVTKDKRKKEKMTLGFGIALLQGIEAATTGWFHCSFVCLITPAFQFTTTTEAAEIDAADRWGMLRLIYSTARG